MKPLARAVAVFVPQLNKIKSAVKIKFNPNMKPEKKIFLDRQDDLTKATEAIDKGLTDKIILNIPKSSVLGEKPKNFEILKKESLERGKELVIESVDEHILELAGIAGLDAINPFFRSRSRVFSDIMPKSAFIRAKSPLSKIQEVKEQIVKEPEEKLTKIKEPEAEIVDFSEKIKNQTKKQSRQVTGFNWRRIIVFGTAVVFVFGLFELALNILPKATISVTLKKIPLNFDEKIEVSSKVIEPVIGINNISLPGELLVTRKNLEMNFQASGQEKVESKARGKLTVYNAYSASPQVLVASTRFESPDKKIFRLDKQVVIPAAQITSGKITPSKIEVAVTADKPGEAYNLASSSAWRIPGFFGTPRYEGFYAEAREQFTGGFVGERAAPTTAEIEKAKSAIQESLKNILKSQMLLSLQADFKNIDAAISFQITKEEIRNDDRSGGFSIFAEGEIRQLIFKEGMLKEALVGKLRESLAAQKLKVNKFELSYGEPEIHLSEGKMILPVMGAVVFESDIDQKSLADQIRGRGQEELKALIFALPGLEKANVSLWPFWVKRVPENTEKVHLFFN